LPEFLPEAHLAEALVAFLFLEDDVVGLRQRQVTLKTRPEVADAVRAMVRNTPRTARRCCPRWG